MIYHQGEGGSLSEQNTDLLICHCTTRVLQDVAQTNGNTKEEYSSVERQLARDVTRTGKIAPHNQPLSRREAGFVTHKYTSRYHKSQQPGQLLSVCLHTHELSFTLKS